MSGNAGPTDTAAWFDVSVVSDPIVAEALGTLLTDWRMAKRWDDLPSAHRRLHEAILHSYIETGRATLAADLAVLAGGDAGPALSDLVARDLIVLENGEVVGAYPFTSRLARQTVKISERTIGAMCAIDALGAGAMARRDAQVHADCAKCGAPIRIEIASQGLKIDRVAPEATMIWAGVQMVSGCAADTQCKSMLMFCKTEHLEDWRTGHARGGPGFRLTPTQALELGAAIFRPFLPAPIRKGAL